MTEAPNMPEPVKKRGPEVTGTVVEGYVKKEIFADIGCSRNLTINTAEGDLVHTGINAEHVTHAEEGARGCVGVYTSWKVVVNHLLEHKKTTKDLAENVQNKTKNRIQTI